VQLGVVVEAHDGGGVAGRRTRRSTTRSARRRGTGTPPGRPARRPSPSRPRRAAPSPWTAMGTGSVLCTVARTSVPPGVRRRAVGIGTCGSATCAGEHVRGRRGLRVLGMFLRLAFGGRFAGVRWSRGVGRSAHSRDGGGGDASVSGRAPLRLGRAVPAGRRGTNDHRQDRAGPRRGAGRERDKGKPAERRGRKAAGLPRGDRRLAACGPATPAGLPNAAE
jgi:hypothetical protein